MTPRMKLIVTLVLVVLLGGMGAADYYLSGNQYAGDVANDGNNNSNTDTMQPPAGAVAKATAPAVSDVASHMNLTVQPNDDLSLLAQIVKDGTKVEGLAILKDGDRAGSVTWVQSGEVKNYFIALKEALLSAFSPQVRDLRDETVQDPGEPVRNILTFLDPSLSEERIVFVRVRERLYEFHLTAGKEEVMHDLIDALTSR